MNLRAVPLLLLAFTLPACTTTTTRPLEITEPLVIPLWVSEAGVGVVTCEASGGSAELALDTGAPHAVQLPIGSPVLEGAPVVDRELAFDAYGRLLRRRVYELTDCTIGGTQIHSVYASELHEPLPPVFDVDGALGMDLFDGLVLDIDYPAERLVVLSPGRLPSDFEQGDWITVPIVDDEHGFAIEVQIDDHPKFFRMILDSGAVAYASDTHYGILDLPEELRCLAHTLGETTVYRAGAVLVGDGAIGPMPFLDLSFPEPPGQSGFLGNALFVHHRVIIDPPNKTVYISK